MTGHKGRKRKTGSGRKRSSTASTATKGVGATPWTRINKPVVLPSYIKNAIQRLDEEGYLAYVVGGCVRDSLLSRQAKDFDIATSALPDSLSRLFPDAIQIGKAFGVIKIPAEEGEFEIATFREDSAYEDYRHPKSVKFSGPEEDARRRDFTVNAMFYDWKTQSVLDTTGGLTDLKKKEIRAIGNPLERFEEDALRLLRAIRFATTLNFTIEPATADAIRKRARLIKKVSAERIRDEVSLMLAGPAPDRAIQYLSEFSLLKHVFPEIEATKGVQQAHSYYREGDAFDDTLRVLSALAKDQERSNSLNWAALLQNIGKPVAAIRNKRKNFMGHEADVVRLSGRAARRMKLPRDDVDRVEELTAEHLKFRDIFQMREATLQRWVRQPYFEDALRLHQANAIASDGNLAFYDFGISKLGEFKAAAPVPKLIDGKDLIQLGFEPGPKFSHILRTIEDLTYEKKLASKEEALEFVVKHFVD